MSKRRRIGLPIYLAPIMFGLMGIFVSAQMGENSLSRYVVLLTSLSVSLLAIGMLVSQLNVSRTQRATLIVGVILLALGALVPIARIGEELRVPAETMLISQSTQLAIRWLGVSSVIVGLFAVVYILMRREEQIEAVGERFRYLADHMSEGFILTAADGTIAVVNDALLNMTGLKADDLVGKSGAELSEQYKLEPMVSHIAQRPQNAPMEYRFAWQRDGKELELWVSGTPLFDSRGHFTGTLATIRDVTEQHQMSKRLERYAQGLQELVEDRTEKLYQSQQRLRDLLLHMNEAFVTLDREYRITFANERFCELLGLNVEAVTGKELLGFVASPDRGRMLELLAAPGKQGSAHPQQELALQPPDSDTVHVVASLAAIEPAPGAEDRYSLVMTDVRELKRMQQQVEVRAAELEEANTELRMLDRAKDNFLSTVSHELRTPLATVRGYTEMLESGTLGQLQTQQSNALKVMSRNLERLGTLIDEIIEFSRMEVRGLLLHQTLFSGEKFLNECAATLAPQAQSRDLHIRVMASPDAAILWGDRRRLVQAVTILLSNSVKFCSPGDIITVSTERRAGGIIAIAVSDTGIGIDPAIQRRVFDKFYQADSSLSRRYEGAGIGLAIAKTISEAHGGHIDLQSEPGKGSTFTIILNMASFLPNDLELLPKLTVERPVLLAISEPEFAAALSEALQCSGISTSTVSSGLACIRALKDTEPCLILVDDVLPDLGGASTVERLQQEAEAKDARVLLMAGNDQTRTKDDHELQGIAQAISKPFTAEELIVAVSSALDLPAVPGATTRRTFRKASAPAVLVISQDKDLLDWVGSALRARQTRCVRASNIEDARSAADRYNICTVAVEADTAGRDSEAFLKLGQQIASELGAQFAELKAVGTGMGGPNGHRIVTVPCSSLELLQALSISTTDVA
ncbi:MAG: PAS domain S-box protein [Candidatus Hydrogenedentes bacterium]|nr:PAS domain S-box protein [Candidatus Hydrogenedentota bacterium]